MNQKLRAFLLLPPSLALVGALIAAPHLVHALDGPAVEATVAQIAEGRLPSRNVTVTAKVMADRGLRYTLTKKNSQTSPKVSFFMPMVDPGNEEAPTQLVAQTFHNEVFDAAEHPDEPLQFEGTVRDVLWEGLDSEVKEALESIHPLDPHVRLLELRGVGTASDRLWGFGAPLAGFLLGLLVAAGVKPAAKKSEAPRA
ncbi:MAG: hypothetical protein Q8K32_29335 [Archangium sp.]|nr:hypothetical protein [Archangium sp.]